MKWHAGVLVLVLVAAGGVVGASRRQESILPPPPGPEHAVLRAFEGTWDFVMPGPSLDGSSAPGSPGTRVERMICGGMWLAAEFSTEMMGQPFTGHMITGWDRFKKKYVGTWVDSFGGELAVIEGSWDAATRTMSLAYDAHEETGEIARFQLTDRFTDENTRIFRVTSTLPKGQPREALVLTYRRRK